MKVSKDAAILSNHSCVFDILILYKVAGFLVILSSIVAVDPLPLPPLTHLSVPHLGFRAPKHPQ